MKKPGPLLIGLAAGALLGAGAVMLTRGPAGGVEEQTRGPGGGGRGGPGAMMPAVSIAVAGEAAVGKTLDAIGEARALKSVRLITEATGIVEAVSIEPGKRVSQGDVLLKLDDRQQRIALDRARAQYPIAKDNADRYSSLEKTEAASALEAEAAFNNFKAVEADLKAAEYAMGQRVIAAPFNGVIGLTEIEAGDYIRAGDVVTTLDDTSSIIVSFTAPQESADALAIGQKVRARLASGGAEHEGVITAIDSRIDPASRTLRAEATFENPSNALFPGAVFAVTTTAEGERAVSVPGLAVQWDRSGPYVWKRAGDGKAVRANVVILQRTDDLVLVKGDLSPGEAVVAEGADRMRPGLPLPAPSRGRAESASAGTGAAPGAD
ncbi:MAG: efflux RND transporter periplasmic adaptor subunit [Parvularculaceae bacterium]